MNILICGSRDWNSRKIMEDVFQVFYEFPKVKIISGGCSGADECAMRLARAMGFEYEEFPADWEKHGKAAGPIRNQEMLDRGKPDAVIAFHDNIEESKGTIDMIRRARAKGIPVLLVRRKLDVVEVI